MPENPSRPPFALELERRAQVAWFALARFLGLGTREELSFLVLTPLVGIVTGFTGVAIYAAIDALQGLLWGGGVGLLEAAQWASTVRPWLNVTAPLVGGLLVVLIVFATKSQVRGGGMSGIIEAVALKGGRLPFLESFFRLLGGIATVGSGGSAGREGPVIRTGAMIGSQMGGAFGVTGRPLKLLVACGAAAGMAAAYNAPIGGALFAMEVLLGNFALEVFGPVVVASVLATFVSRTFRSPEAIYLIPEMKVLSPGVRAAAPELLAYLVLGSLGGALSHYFAKLVRGGDTLFDRVPLPNVSKPILGMLLCGLIGLFCPYIYGNGFDTVSLALNDKLTIGLLLVLPLLKILATSLTLGSGCSGGVFTPALFVGGLLGGAYGLGVHALLPGAEPRAFALVGMAAITAGTSHAPLSALIIIFEMTNHRYEAVLPLMLAAMSSAAVARLFGKHSIYTEALARKGIELPSRLEEIVLETIRVSEVVREDGEAAPPGEPLERLVKRFFRAKRTHVFLVDFAGIYRGAVSLYDLEAALKEPESFGSVVAADLVDAQFPCVREADRLVVALDVFARTDGEHLPVVAQDGKTFKGAIGKSDLLALYSQEVLGHPALLARIGQVAGRESFVPLPHGFELRVLEVSGALAGKSLQELELPKKHGVWVLAVVCRDEAGRETRLLASATTRVERGDKLVALGTSEGLARLAAAPPPQAPPPQAPPSPREPAREAAPEKVLPEARTGP